MNSKSGQKPMEIPADEMVAAVVKLQTMIQAHAYSILRDFHSAEDVYQEVATIIMKRWNDIPHGQELIYWTRETTRRKSLEAVRKRKKVPMLLEEDVLMAVAEEFEQEDAEDDNRHELMDILNRCVSQLHGTAKTVLDARFGETPTPSCEEIAERMGRSVQAVYGILKRARIALLKCAKQEGLAGESIV